MNCKILILAIIVFTACTATASADDGAADEIMKQSHLAYYYAADGGRAKVSMIITDAKGRTRERQFWILRRDVADMGDQWYYTYFLKPADIARTSFLVHKKAEANDDRWLYLPALDLVKRIAADDRHSSFVGSDFTYEDISGRLPALDQHEMGGADTLMGCSVKKVKSTPRESKSAAHAFRVSWIDETSHLPLQEEYFDKHGSVTRRLTLGKIETIEGIPTATERTMTDVKEGRSTTIKFSDITYKTDFKPEDFNEQLLKNPPAEFTK